MTTGEASQGMDGSTASATPKKTRVRQSRQRACQIIARVSDQEYKEIAKAAKEVRLTVSAYVRHCLFLHQQAREQAKRG